MPFARLKAKPLQSKLAFLESVEPTEKPTSRFFCTRIKIEQNKANKIFALLRNLNINTQPEINGGVTYTQDAQGNMVVQKPVYLDGMPPQLEYSDREHYIYKLFYNKEQEAVVRRFQDSVRQILNSDGISARFIKRIPFEFFHTEYNM